MPKQANSTKLIITIMVLLISTVFGMQKWMMDSLKDDIKGVRTELFELRKEVNQLFHSRQAMVMDHEKRIIFLEAKGEEHSSP